VLPPRLALCPRHEFAYPHKLLLDDEALDKSMDLCKLEGFRALVTPAEQAKSTGKDAR
jgi:hypothetical protein